MSKDIATYIKEELSVELYELEAYRKKLFNHMIMMLIFNTGIMIFIELDLITDYPLRFGPPAVKVLTFITYIAISIFLSYFLFIKKFKLKYKNTLILKAFHYFDPNIIYQPKGFITEDIFRKSMIFQHTNFNRYGGEDLINGVYNDTEFFVSEVKAQYKSGGKNSSTHTIFEGIFLDAYMNKRIDGYLVISYKKDISQIATALSSFVKNLFGMKENFKEYKGVKDRRFNETYNVYCSHSFIAETILKPDFIDKALEFSKFDRPIVFSFVDDHFYIATPNKKNLFEGKLHKSILGLDNIESEMNEYMELINTIKVLDVKDAVKRVDS